MAIAALVALWLHSRPGPAHIADAEQWLSETPTAARIKAAMSPVLTDLWTQAWQGGSEAASETTGRSVRIPDQVAADRIARLAAKWLDEVTATRTSRIAEILARGGTAAELEASIRALLNSETDARMVAITEVSRAMQAAAMEAYRAAGVKKVRWITRSGHPCPVCLANEAAGPRWLGEPFPSGDTMPPAHPNCECALIPADEV
jgi:hypothetical protein